MRHLCMSEYRVCVCIVSWYDAPRMENMRHPRPRGVGPQVPLRSRYHVNPIMPGRPSPIGSKSQSNQQWADPFP